MRWTITSAGLPVPVVDVLCYHIPLDCWNCSRRRIDSALLQSAQRASDANHNRRARMQHGLMYQGSFENNYSGLEAGSSAFRGTDGGEHSIPEWPEDGEGVRIGCMGRPGKKFYAVRVRFEAGDIILENAGLLDAGRARGKKRDAPDPTSISDR